VEAGSTPNSLVLLKAIDAIENTNAVQIFSLVDSAPATSIRYMKFTFHSSTDFFGRITIYNLDIYGLEE